MTKRDQIPALVGEEAAGLVYRANAWLLRGALAVFPTAPALALISFELHFPGLWILIGACFLAAIARLVVGGRLNRKESYASSKFVTNEDKRWVTVKSGGIRLRGWQIEIERQHLADESWQSEKKAAADLRAENSFALCAPASVLAIWNLQARGRPRDASPGLGVICGV